jgi:hypothetical protein
MAIASYLFGYLLDSVDGKIARRYNMKSDIGMALDATSDVVTNYILFLYILYKYDDKININIYIIFFIFTFGVIMWYSINEAIMSYKETGNDNFYETKFKMLYDKRKGLNKIIYDIYLLINYIEYSVYKVIFPVHNKEKLYNSIKFFKEFGGGNYILFISILIIYITRK